VTRWETSGGVADLERDRPASASGKTSEGNDGGKPAAARQREDGHREAQGRRRAEMRVEVRRGKPLRRRKPKRASGPGRPEPSSAGNGLAPR
jgi:hypothetical protein